MKTKLMVVVVVNILIMKAWILWQVADCWTRR